MKIKSDQVGKEASNGVLISGFPCRTLPLQIPIMKVPYFGMNSFSRKLLGYQSFAWLIFLSSDLNGAMILSSNDSWQVTPGSSGSLIVSEDLSVLQGIDYGTAVTAPVQAAVQLNYFPTEKAAKSDITDAQGAFVWRDNLADTARNKMTLDGNNLLSLFSSNGAAAGITFNGSTGQISLSGTNPGIEYAGAPVFTVGVLGELGFGNRSLKITNASPATSSSTGALTVAGGIGASMDSYFNGVRIGRGAGNMPYNTVMGCQTMR